MLTTASSTLNYPNPYYLAWCHEHRPEVLQVIDQPVYADVLIPHIYRSGLYVHTLETYSLWVQEGDYSRAVLRVAGSASAFTDIPSTPPSRVRRAAQKAEALLRGRR